MKTPMNTEKLLARLTEEIKSRGLESKEEINELLQKMLAEGLDELPDRTDNIGRSQNLVFEAYEQSETSGKKLIKQALELDPNNAEAYNYLASIEKDVDKAIIQYEKAIKAGEKSLGKKFFKEEKGHFWGFIETRPYMRAKAGLADCFYAKKEVDKALEIYEEMLELNPNDNQGIRYLVSTILLGKNDLAKYNSFMGAYQEDCAVMKYNNALYHFKKSGPSTKSEKELAKAFRSNQHVIDYMLGIKELPSQQPQYVGRGDENEAVAYVSDAWKIWEKSADALDWLYAFKQKRIKKK